MPEYKGMIENGPLSSSEGDAMNPLSLRKRDIKAIEKPETMDKEVWDKICEVNSQTSKMVAEQSPQRPKDKNAYFYSVDQHSVISDIENHKEP
jgi:hypothetical protein